MGGVSRSLVTPTSSSGAHSSDGSMRGAAAAAAAALVTPGGARGGFAKDSVDLNSECESPGVLLSRCREITVKNNAEQCRPSRAKNG